MKTNLLTLILLFFAIIAAAQQTTLKSLDVQKCLNIKMKIPNKEIKRATWEEDEIRVEITLVSDLPNEVLQALLKAGRYELVGKKDSNDYIVTAPNMNFSLEVNQVKIKEELIIKISTPEYIVMNDRAELYKDINEQVIRSRSDTREELAAVLDRMRAIRETIKVSVSVQSTSTFDVVDLSTFMISLEGKELAVDQVSFSAF